MTPLGFMADGSVRIPVYVSRHIPLRRRRRLASDDYDIEMETDILCIRHDGAIFVHPDRMSWFAQLERRP
jgi:hypothetical protein